MSNIFYEGQQVGCLKNGVGTVVSVYTASVDFPVTVKFSAGSQTYSLCGVCDYNSYNTLYPIEQYREIIANLPAPQPEAWKPKPGEWCWFWNWGYVVRLDQFAEYLLPSENYKTKTGNWYKCCASFIGELPEHLKEVQP